MLIETKISRRLEAALSYVVPNGDLWDICCDHGLLGLAAANRELAKQVYFVDQAPHLIQALPRIENGIYLSLPGEEIQQIIKGTVVILGVGDFTIQKILRSLQGQGLLQAGRLILGPHKNPERIANLDLENYQLVEKVTVDERGRERILYIFDQVGVGSSHEISNKASVPRN